MDELPRDALLRRVPPHDLEAEHHVLGTLLCDPTELPHVSEEIVPQDFYKQEHATIYQVMLELHEDRAPLEIAAVVAALRDRKLLDVVGGAGRLAELTSSVSSGNAAYYARRIRDKARKRTALAACSQATIDIYDSPDAASDLLPVIEEKVFAALRDKGTAKVESLGEIVAQAEAEVDRERRGEGKGLKTGFRALDGVLHVRFDPGSLNIIAARPGVGKTTSLVNLARNLSSGRNDLPQKKTVFVTLEDPKTRIAIKLAGALAGVRPGEGMSDFDFTDFQMACREVEKWALSVIEQPCGYSVVELRSLARRLKAEEKLDILLVDYLQYLSSGRTGGKAYSTRHEEVSEVSRGLKALAGELEIPVVTAAQLNREAESRPDRKPRISDLRESGSLEQDASIVILLGNPSDSLKKEEIEAQGLQDRIFAHVAKNRYGPTGEATLFYDNRIGYMGDTDGQMAMRHRRNGSHAR